ncbi:MAG: hypothetical protein LBI36_04345 [Oscillospiraceae bacterium]|jgi:hypothetical protein|nr:hypothetical protein [Oscillospiraceae bacterium]
MGKSAKIRERYDLNELSDVIERASRSLCGAVRYVRAVAESEFYNVNVKDLFKISLSDITNPAILSNLGVCAETKSEALNGAGFSRVANMVFYAFAVRLPFFRRAEDGVFVKDSRLSALYETCVSKGAENYGGIIHDDFKSMMKAAKRRETQPPFTAEWFRRWVYSEGGELAAINNRNMFLLGCADALFPLYHAALWEKLTEMFGEKE